MEKNEPKTSVGINDKELEDEMNKLEITIEPQPKIDNINNRCWKSKCRQIMFITKRNHREIRRFLYGNSRV